jgi:predicted O-methyltransferase YrrM
LRLAARDPAEALDRVRSKLEHRIDRRTPRPEPGTYEVSRDFDRRLHERLGAPFPCEAAAEFAGTWSELDESLAASSSFIGAWVHDADENLARTVWCLVRHLRPQRVVETGVARGITTRVLLEALDRNGDGRLWSVDLPLLRTPWHDQTAAAVPESLHPRWTYVRGSSRRRLPGLLAELGEIDVFVHDSAHTQANMRFEFESAWSALRPGGALVSHDVQGNAAFADFAAATSQEPLYARYDEGPGLVGILVQDAQG